MQHVAAAASANLTSELRGAQIVVAALVKQQGGEVFVPDNQLVEDLNLEIWDPPERHGMVLRARD